MVGYKENYNARYVYNAVSEFIYFLIIYIKQNGEANILNIVKYMKFFKQEVKCFVESFHGITLEEKLKNMLCESTFIFSASEKCLTLTEEHETYKRKIFVDIISSKVIDLILKDICKVDDIWHNLKLNNVFFFIDKCSLLSLLLQSPHFDVKHLNYISINKLNGVFGYDSLIYKTVINYFQSYLQCNKKLSYFELKKCSFLDVCEINNALKMLCVMFCSKFFKCRKGCIKLSSKLKQKSQQIKKLDLEKLLMKEPVCGISIGYVIYKQHGPHLISWVGEIGNLSQNYGLIYCVAEFIDCYQGIFCVFFTKMSLQQVSEIKDLRDCLGVRDIVEFHAEYYEGSKGRFWKATKIEIIKTTFKHNLKLICDDSIEDRLSSFQETVGLDGLGQNCLFNQNENDKSKMKSESLKHCNVTKIPDEANICTPGMGPTLESDKVRIRTELKTPSRWNMSLPRVQNSVTEKVIDQTQLKCTTSRTDEIKFSTSLLNSESFFNSESNCSVEMKNVNSNASSPKITLVSDTESLYTDKLCVPCANGDQENLAVANVGKGSLHVLNVQKCINESSSDILQGTKMEKELLLDSSDKQKSSDITTYTIEINEKLKENAGELKILSKTKENCSNQSSFLCVSNIEFSNFLYMFGNVTVVTDDTGIASSMCKYNQFDVFFRFETIYPVSNLKVVNLGQKVLLYVPYSAERGNDVLAATFVYLVNSKEIIEVEKYSLSAEEFAVNILHDAHVNDHSCHYSCLGINSCMLTDKKSLKLKNAFLACLHIAFQLNLKFKREKKLCKKRNITVSKKKKKKMFSDKTIFLKRDLLNLINSDETVPNFMNCEDTATESRLSDLKSSNGIVLSSNSSNSCKSTSSSCKNSFGSCNSFFTCDSYEDDNEEAYYSCDSVFSLDENIQDKCSINESASLVPNLNNSSHYVHSFQSNSNGALVPYECNQLLGAEYNSNLLAYCSTIIESKQCGNFNSDCYVTDSTYLNSKRYLKLKSVPIFKHHRRKVVAKSANKYGCIKCLKSLIVTKAFVCLITESNLILNFKIKTHNVFVGYPMHLIPDDSKHRIKLNSIVKIMVIPEKILNLSHVLALQLCTS